MKERWPVIAFVILLAVAVGIQVAEQLGFGGCAAPLAQIAENKAICNPFEFWLNRYQTLLASIIGIAIAVYVTRPVIEQARGVNRQIDFAKIPGLRIEANNLETERESIDQQASIAENITNYLDKESVIDRFEMLYAFHDEINRNFLHNSQETARRLRDARKQYPTNNLNSARTPLIEATEHLIIDLKAIDAMIKRRRSNDVSMSSSEFDLIIEAVRQSAKRLLSAYAVLRRALTARIDEYWLTIERISNDAHRI